MVSKDEITQVASMMRLDISDKDDYIKKVQDMLDYFDTLDSAGVEDETIMTQHIAISQLRPDIHTPHDTIKLKSENERGYLKAPRLG